MDTNSTSPSIASLPRSTTQETKEKFDLFLKSALTNKSSQEKDDEQHSPENLDVDDLDGTSELENRQFILNKYFETNVINVQHKPVPKPRRKLKSNREDASVRSNETFHVTKPTQKVEMNEIEDADIKPSSPASSTGTFKVTIPKILKTYNEIEPETPKVGDIIIHHGHKRSLKDTQSNVIEVELNPSPKLASEIASVHSRRSKNSIDNEKEKKIVTENEIPEKVMNLIIHKSNKLLLNSLVIHPVVKIHFTDINSGDYYPKNNKNKSVVYFYDNNLDYIAPVMTHPFNLQEQRSLVPAWEETILINEDFDYLHTERENIVIFFEILDFYSPSNSGRKRGWHQISFAFLKLNGKNNAINLGREMRLQLYHYPSSIKPNLCMNKCPVWDAWHKGDLKKYPSCLVVTIESVDAKNGITTTGLRSKSATQIETATNPTKTRGSTNNPTSSSSKIELISSFVEKQKKMQKTSAASQILPNKCIAQFHCEDEGCFTLKFSNNGEFLACAFKEDKVYAIVIFSVGSFEELCTLPGHQGMIYSICWSLNDEVLIAASADSSVSVWNVPKASFLQILPHPNFVYSAHMNSDIIVTGCYDTIIRIWKLEGNTGKFLLRQEIEGGHAGYITCVRLNGANNRIFSSDSVGAIMEWSSESDSDGWKFERKIKITDLEDIIINQIELIERDRRLLVHSRDSILRIIDLKSSIVINWLQGGLNSRFRTSCSVSACGRYVATGSENSHVNIWKIGNGKYVGRLVPLENQTVTFSALDFNPKINGMLAVGQFGNDFPVLLFGHDENTENTKEVMVMQSENDKIKRRDSNGEKMNHEQTEVNYKNILSKLDRIMSSHNVKKI